MHPVAIDDSVNDNRVARKGGGAGSVKPVGPEAVPGPRYLKVLVQDDNHVADRRGGSAVNVMVPKVEAMTAVSPLGRSVASWSNWKIWPCPIAASSALTAFTFVSRRLSPARSISRNVDRGGGRQERAAQQVHRTARIDSRGKAGEVIAHRVVVPIDVARQVCGHGVDLLRRSRCGGPCSESCQRWR